MRKKTLPKSAPIETPATGQAEQPEKPAKVSTAKQPRLVLPLTPEGSIDLASMQEGTRERLKTHLLDTAFLADLGIEAPVQLDTIGPREVTGLYAIVGQFTTWAATSLLGAPPELARKVCAYDDADLSMLVEPTSIVLNKRLSGSLKKHKDEAMLMLALTAVHQRKWFVLKQLIAASQKAMQTREGSANNTGETTQHGADR